MSGRVPWLAFALFALVTPVAAEDWPRWRGPRGDGTWNAPKLPETWPVGGLKTVWKQPVGGGYAGITVADGRVYVFDLEAPIPSKSRGTEPDGTERVQCYDASSGKLLWSHSYPVAYGQLGGYANGPRSAPTFHEGNLYTLGAVGHAFCFEAASGKVVWKCDAVVEFGAKVPEWGYAAAPVIHGRTVILHVGAKGNGCLLALDRDSGREVWRCLPDPAGYCTPAIVAAPSGPQLVFWTPENIHGVDPANGKPLWKVPYKVTYGVSIAAPLFAEGIVFITGYWEGSKAIRLGKQPTDRELIWTDNKSLRGLMAQPLFRAGHVFTIDKNLGLTCFELASGKKLWDDDNQLTPRGRNPHASIVWVNDGDRALGLNSVGDLVLCRLNPKGFDEQSRTKVLNGRVWGHPAFAGRFLFAKTDGGEGWQNARPHELVCVELVAEIEKQ